MWDFGYTIRHIRQLLASTGERRRLSIMAKILRSARDEDVWKFISVQDFLREREMLMRCLGGQRDFWEFMYRRWGKGFIPALTMFSGNIHSRQLR